VVDATGALLDKASEEISKKLQGPWVYLSDRDSLMRAVFCGPMLIALPLVIIYQTTLTSHKRVFIFHVRNFCGYVCWACLLIVKMSWFFTKIFSWLWAWLIMVFGLDDWIYWSHLYNHNHSKLW
jgi:hypothetical protein